MVVERGEIITDTEFLNAYPGCGGSVADLDR
jgi:hypothetical protein